jgi:ubiquinone/menaquinone biosynthesis C-methylase UbiE
MAEMIRTMGQYGLDKAISIYIKDPFVANYVLDEGRALLTKLLPLCEDTKVLDVGCGWGTISIPIARIAGQVDVIDATYERVKFVETRAQYCCLSNISPVLGSATALPFPSERFDIVVFNGVLEWLGAINTKESPYKIQMHALKEAYRVLKPGGLVYVGIENRFSLRYFLGDPDDHSFIRFTSLMPRGMAQIYYKMRTSRDYFMHTHSLSAYRKMLKNSGFSKVKEYHPWPTYRTPTEFAELNVISILKQLRRKVYSEHIFSRKWIYLQLLKVLTTIEKQGSFCHSFSFIYIKD